ncbi:MAG TPA: HAD-IA family hydrolase, partial [Candidatus Obscuribacterales bacterium]
KPDPAPYQYCLEQLNILPEEAIAFEDSPSGIRSAIAAGIKTIGVASTHDPNRLKDLGVALVIEDFTQVYLQIMG